MKVTVSLFHFPTPTVQLGTLCGMIDEWSKQVPGSPALEIFGATAFEYLEIYGNM